MTDTTTLEILADLLRFREKTLYHSLMQQMSTLAKEGKKTFEIMMRQCSDLI
jgi:hypothetical protein